MERTWEVEKTWRKTERDADRYGCYTTNGHIAARLLVVGRRVSVVLSSFIDEECDLGHTGRMPYDEAQVLLACFDLTPPPLPEVTGG